jgi:hypothetical protein
MIQVVAMLRKNGVSGLLRLELAGLGGKHVREPD